MYVYIYIYMYVCIYIYIYIPTDIRLNRYTEPMEEPEPMQTLAILLAACAAVASIPYPLHGISKPTAPERTCHCRNAA